MRRGGRAAALPPAGRRRARRGVRGDRGRGAGAAAAARSCWRNGHGARSDRTSCQVPQTLYSVPWKHIGQTLDARSTATWCGCSPAGPGQDARAQAAGQADRPGRLPAGEVRVPHAHPILVPEKGRGDRAGLRRADRRAAARQRALPAARRPGRSRAGRQAPAWPARGRLRQGSRRGDPSYPTVKGILAAGTESSPAAAPTGDGGAAAFLHGPEALFAVGQRRRAAPGRSGLGRGVVTSVTADAPAAAPMRTAAARHLATHHRQRRTAS